MATCPRILTATCWPPSTARWRAGSRCRRATAPRGRNWPKSVVWLSPLGQRKKNDQGSAAVAADLSHKPRERRNYAARNRSISSRDDGGLKDRVVNDLDIG